jgi:hypothetical protein
MADTVVEVSMWAKGRFKAAVGADDTYFQLADNIGFTQAVVGDIVVVAGNPRAPEQMLVTGFDETNYYIRVQRGYNGSPTMAYRRGTSIKIFLSLNSVGSTEMTLTDVVQVDGTTEEDVLTKSTLIYEWAAQDTCLPGCYYLEFKLLKMTEVNGGTPSLLPSIFLTDIIPSFVTPSSSDLGCELGEGVEWVRRFPANTEGYLIEIVDSHTSELLM